jgi:hypothetical protein
MVREAPHQRLEDLRPTYESRNQHCHRRCLAEDVIEPMPYYCARRFHEGARVVTDRLVETFLRRADVSDAAETGSR